MSTVVDGEFFEVCRTRFVKIMKTVQNVPISEYMEGKQLRIISKAWPYIQTLQHKDQVIGFLDSLYRTVSGAQEENSKIRILNHMASADPAIFFDFCSQPVQPAEAKKILQKLRQNLRRRVPNREHAVELICNYAIRRLIGDKTARSPLLIGPPGGGKSELVCQFAKAMTVVGIGSEAIFQPMTQDSNHMMANEGAMRLHGSSLHYSNGAPGCLYETVSKPEIRLGILLLDEADKTHQKDYLVGLLDPKTPLEDNFIREIVKGVDLRSKILMLLTANDASCLNRGPDDPLWSRLEPTLLQAYSGQEMIELAIQIVTNDPENPYRPTRTKARKLAKEAVADLGEKASFRAVLDRVNHKLFIQEFEVSEMQENKNYCVSVITHRQIGFKL
jgi:hypothetical protein